MRFWLAFVGCVASVYIGRDFVLARPSIADHRGENEDAFFSALNEAAKRVPCPDSSNNRSATGYDIVVRCRRMGEDNGKDQLVHVTNYLHRIKEYIRQRVRKLSPEEAERAIKIASNR